MRYAIINNGLVENVIEYDAPPSNPPPGFTDGFVAVQSDTASPGWRYENGSFVDPAPPPPPIPAPSQISDRQFFQMAAIDGFITQDEALAAVATGTIPASLQTIVDGITDPAQQFAAKMLLSGATVFERHHPLTETVGAAFGWTSQQIDTFFQQASAL